ncbi:MAG: succinyl-diaminopimelate desuccinylase [Gammaproteobacteria bacterium]|jgi:succinyl-diaminopimelate desuccinylase|nr:succinyl-diaminopimelate desuccinylase [Gammaproteobacteria bacterium]
MSATLTLAKEILSRPSITPDDHGCQQIIAQRLKAIGFEITDYPLNQVSNLWAKRGTQEPTLCFAGHTDVVPVGKEADWLSPPFIPTIRDGKLYARGAADMKSSIAAMITACERFIKKHPSHQGSIAFLITSDEEGTAIDGTQAVLKQLKSLSQIPTWCLVGEASSTDKLADTIKVGRRGSLTADVTVIGKQGHVAYPHLAKNPIHMALKALAEIAQTTWDLGYHPFPATTLQFANIHAGTGANNVIPGILETNFNLRFSPALTPETIQQKVETILQQHDVEYEIKWRLSGKPFYTNVNSKLVQSVTETIERVLGYCPIHSTTGGTSDGRFFAEYGVQVVEIGPNNSSIHQVNEWIDVEELEQLSHLYEAILVDLLVR